MDDVRMVTLGKRQLRVAVRPGIEPARSLLLCNGIGARLEVLDPIVEALDPAITVVRFDPPGVGGSPLPYPFPLLARLVGLVMTELGYRQFDVLGISWGGGLAQQLAFQNPRRCRRLVLAATAAGWTMVPGSPRVLLRMATPRRHRESDYARSIAGDLYGGLLRERPGLAQHLITDRDRATSLRGYAYQLAACAGWTSLPFLPLIRQPTLILAGDDDPIVPLINAKLLARMIPNSRLHVYQDGHLGLLTLAAELVPMVARFLAHPERGGPGPSRGSDVAAR